MTQRQRGGLVLDLIIAAAIAAALGTVAFSVRAAYHNYTNRFVMEGFAKGQAAQLAADQPKVDAAEATARQAVADRDTARGNSARCEATLKISQDATAEWSAAALRAAAAGKGARADAEKAARDAAPYIADLQTKAAAAPKLQACEKERDLAKCTLANEIRRARKIAPIKCDS